MGNKFRKFMRTIKHNRATELLTLPYNQGKVTGQAIKAYKKVKPILEHVDKCERCKPIFFKIQNCPDIKALPNGSFKEANQHILKHPPCRTALAEIMQCSIYKEKNKNGN